MNVDIIIPCFNEDKNIKTLVNSWEEVLSRNANFFVWFVDNGSTDSTNKNLMNCLSNINSENMKVLTIQKNKGYGNGIKYGISNSKNEIVCWTHADLQIPSVDVEQIINEHLKLKNNKAVMKGTRINRNRLDQFFTFMMSVIGYLFTGQFIRDINAQPKIVSRKLLADIDNYPDDFLLDAHLLYKLKKQGISINSRNSHFLKREANNSKGGGSLLGKIKLSTKTIKYFLNFY
jgi:glycosyltransferase involved in cell wall biosynthesis